VEQPGYLLIHVYLLRISCLHLYRCRASMLCYDDGVVAVPWLIGGVINGVVDVV